MEDKMPTKLIQLKDGIFVEVEAKAGEVQQVSSRAADKVAESISKIHDLILLSCAPVVSAWDELNKDFNIQQAEIELGISFEAEGNLYITKAKTNANLTIKLVLHSTSKA